jgi:hypothetical protein
MKKKNFESVVLQAWNVRENVKSKNKKEDGEGRWEVVTRPERNGGIKLFLKSCCLLFFD